MTTPQRWTYSASDPKAIVGLNELIMLGFQSSTSTSTLQFHQHENAYEFVYVERGKATWEVDGTYYVTNAGELFHTRPNELHRARYNVIEPCQIWWLILAVPHPSSSQSTSWLLTSKQESQYMLTELEKLPRTLPMNHRLGHLFQMLRKSLEFHHELTLLHVRQQILHFLFFICEQATLAYKRESNFAYTSILKQQLESDWSWRPTVEEIAQPLGYSASHFHKLFREQTGLSPISFLERLRIEEACRLLQETSEKITEIANLLGYSSSQHFATTFLRYVGSTPKEWRTQSQLK